VFGYHLTASTGTLFLFGILVGAVGLLELRVRLSGPRRTAGRGPDTQPRASNVKWRSSTEPATPGSNTNSEPTAPRSHRRPDEGATRRRRTPLPSRWSRDRQSMNSGRVDEARQPTWGADMATNTTVLIVVTTLAALVLAGMLVGVAYKTRTRQRNIKGEAIRDQAGEDALRLRRREAIADEARDLLGGNGILTDYQVIKHIVDLEAIRSRAPRPSRR
jgi:hypothetical protein